MKRILAISSALLLAAACGDKAKDDKPVDQKTDVTPDNPADGTAEFKQENFVKGVNNPYFTLVPGRKLDFDGTSPDGKKIHKEIITSDRTQEIDGISTVGVWERQWENETLVSDTKKWYAQDKEGNVWLFGADDKEIFGGFVKSDDYSWKSGEKSGENEAKAGIVVPFSAKLGDTFTAEYDGFNKLESKILGIEEKIKVPQGEFTNCLKLSDYGTSGDTHQEHRYYCKDSGSIALELIPDSKAKLELSKVQDNAPYEGFDIKYPEFKPALNADAAKAAALDKIDNAEKATSVELTLWENKPAYAVSLVDKEEKAKLAYIDVNTGAVLKVLDK